MLFVSALGVSPVSALGVLSVSALDPSPELCAISILHVCRLFSFPDVPNMIMAFLSSGVYACFI